MRNIVLYIGSFCISKMDAQSQLVIGNCMALRELGYDVILIGNDSSMAQNQDPIKNHVVLPEGFECYNILFRKSAKEIFGNIQYNACKKIIRHIGEQSIKYVFCYGSTGFASVLFLLSNSCHRNKINIIYNCVDIPDVNHGTRLERIVKKIDRSLLMQRAIERKMDGLIAVSSYIEKFFSARRSYPTIIVPPLKDTQVLPAPSKANYTGIPHIVYVGVPFPIDGREVKESAYKDRIDLFIDLLYEIKDVPYKLDIYGFEKEQYERVVKRQKDLLSEMADRIEFHERIGHDKALEIVSNADYTVVYRVKNQMTMAGFSTKFVETVCCGAIPIITDTSEYVRYREKGVEMILLDIDDHDQQVRALRDCLTKKQDEIFSAKRKNYESRAFDYRNYISPFKDLLDRVDRASEGKGFA